MLSVTRNLMHHLYLEVFCECGYILFHLVFILNSLNEISKRYSTLNPIHNKLSAQFQYNSQFSIITLMLSFEVA